MMHLKIGKYENEQFIKLKESNPKQLSKELYSITVNLFKKSEIIAKLVANSNNLKDIADILDISYNITEESGIKYLESEDYKRIKEVLLKYNYTEDVDFYMYLLHYYDIVATEKIGSLFQIHTALKRVDFTRLYAVCKSTGNLGVYRKYFHNEYCKDLEMIGGDYFPYILGTPGVIKLEDNLRNNKKVSYIRTNEFGTKIYDIKPNISMPTIKDLVTASPNMHI